MSYGIQSLIPAIGGAIASYFGGPWAGAAAGAALGAATGPKKNGMLMNAGLGALGGWGGGQLASSFASAGLGELSTPLAEGMTQGLDLGVGSSATGGTGIMDLAPANAYQAAAAAEQAVPLTGADPAGLVQPDFSAANYYTPQSAYSSLAPDVQANADYSRLTTPVDMGKPQQSYWDQLVNGVSNVGNAPKEENQKRLKYGLMAMAPMLGAPYGQNSGAPASGVPATGMVSPYAYNQMQPRYDAYGNYLGASPASFTAGAPYRAAAGGLMGLAGGGAPLPPRMLKGPGTGLSDSIPAEIQGGQKAALADGEFVVSADVVSALGGGSTDAGARKLYAMMDRVRKNAHGHKKQIKKVNDNKVMPV